MCRVGLDAPGLELLEGPRRACDLQGPWYTLQTRACLQELQAAEPPLTLRTRPPRDRSERQEGLGFGV